MELLDIFRWFIIVFGSLIFGFNIALFLHIDPNTRKHYTYKGLLIGRNGILTAVILAAVGSLQDWTETTKYFYNILVSVSLITSGICLILIYKDHVEDGHVGPS